MAIILGIDPGSQKTGFGIIDSDAAKGQCRHRYITSGVIRLPREPLPERLRIIADAVAQLVDEHQPDELSVEQVFLARSADAAIKLGQARGAAIVPCVTRGLAVSEYSARTIKQSVVGTGAADKKQVQHMVRVLLGLPDSPQEDAADALAAALCHAHMRQGLAGLAGVTGITRTSSMRRRRLR